MFEWKLDTASASLADIWAQYRKTELLLTLILANFQTSKHNGIENFFRYNISSPIIVFEQFNRKLESISSAGI